MGAYDNIDFENARLGDIGDSSEIFQTRQTVVGRKYKIKFEVYVEPPTMNTGWWHVSFCKQKDVNGILIIRNTAEDNYTHPEAFEAIMCPQPFLVNEWQKVSALIPPHQGQLPLPCTQRVPEQPGSTQLKFWMNRTMISIAGTTRQQVLQVSQSMVQGLQEQMRPSRLVLVAQRPRLLSGYPTQLA